MFLSSGCFFLVPDTSPTEIYTLSLHDALPISVALGPMPWLGDKPPGASCLRVPCDGLAAVIDLDRMCADPKIHALADQAVRNRVITALVLDVVVEEHLGALPGGVLVALQRERPQRRLIKLEEATAARPRLARER